MIDPEKFRGFFSRLGQQKPTDAGGWQLSDPLCDFGAGDYWTLGNSFEGTIIFGATGSGKTSGSGRLLAKTMLQAGYGGLVLCVKEDEPDLWQRYARETGREQDLIFFSQASLNVLGYEASRVPEEARTEAIVALYFQLYEISANRHGRGSGDDYWERAGKQLLRAAVDLLGLAGVAPTLRNIHSVLQSLPTRAGDTAADAWRDNSACFAYYQQAAKRVGEDHPDLQADAAYLLAEFPSMDERPRSSIMSTITTISDVMARGLMRERFCEKTTMIPEDMLAGKIVVVDFPIKTFHDGGKFAGVLWKYMAQRMIERRPDRQLGDGMRPVFVWADEYQYFSTEHDSLAATTARSSRLAQVFLTQNISNLYAASGGGEQARARVDSLLGNMALKIFHQSGDSITNEWASRAIGQRLIARASGGRSHQLFEFWNPTISRNWSQQWEPLIQPIEFSKLRRGGIENGLQVDAILWRSGIPFLSGQQVLKSAFSQTF